MAHKNDDEVPCGAAGGTCFTGSDTVTETRWKYTPVKGGDWDLNEEYRFVGDGQGSYRRHANTLWKCRPCCLIFLLILLLLLLCGLFFWLLFGGSGHREEASSTTTTLPYDCTVGLSDWQAGWTENKKQWCCQHEKLGCVTAAAKPYDCALGDPNTWSQAQVDWCCEMECVCPCEENVTSEVVSTPEETWLETSTEEATTETIFATPLATTSTTTPTTTSTTTLTTTSTTTVTTTSTTTVTTTSTTAAIASTSAATVAATTTSQAPLDVLTCDLHCFNTGGPFPVADPVALQGSVGEGGGAVLNKRGVEECRHACRVTEGCNAVVFSNKTELGYSQCFGKHGVDTSRCQLGGAWITELIGDYLPWGRCAIFGDPHVLTFDRPFGPPITDVYPGIFHMIKSPKLQVQARFSYTLRFQTDSSTVGIAVGGSRLNGHTLVVDYVGPGDGLQGFQVLWDGERILQESPSTFNSSDGALHAQQRDMDPDLFHREGRHTIGGAFGSGKLPSYLFRMPPDFALYVLVGPDNCNVVIETRKAFGGQDGFCGNFNCDSRDDALYHMMMRGALDPIRREDSLFKDAPEPAKIFHTAGPVVTLENCDAAVKARATQRCKSVSPDLQKECVLARCVAFDAGQASDLDAGEKASVESQTLPFTCRWPGGGLWTPEEVDWCCEKKNLGCSLRHPSPALALLL